MSIAMILLALLFQGASADETTFVENWQIEQGDDDCLATAIYNPNVILLISRDWKLNVDMVGLYHPSFASIKDGDKFTADLLFRKGPLPVRRFDRSEFIGTRLTDTVNMVFFARPNGELLPLLEMSDGVVFRFTGQPEIGLEIKGIGEAVKALQQCVALASTTSKSERR